MRDAARTDRLFVFARHDLVGPTRASDGSALLLEGSWPDGPAYARRALDDEIDARFGWIDRAATELAEQAGAAPSVGEDYDGPQAPSEKGGRHPAPCANAFPDPQPPGASSPFRIAAPIHPAWLNALALRYYLVKLIRLVAYFTEIRPLTPRDCVEFVAARGRDDDYADCLAGLCRQAGATCRVEWVDRPERAAQAFPPNGRWRRGLARLCGLLDPSPSAGGARRRVVLCGNPRFLDPVCRALVERDCRVWWLYDRFAIRSWLRWRLSGAGQLVCESSAASENRLAPAAAERLDCRGVNLAEPVARWLAERVATHGPRETRITERIDAHFRRVRPHALVLDEDGTPMARAAAALARQHGATSWVVQHGAPVCRFGFAPLAADRIFVWGQSSQEQLTRWGVPAERIRVVGSPQHDRRQSRIRRYRRWPPRVLLLATTPPRDDRPDAIAMHFTGRTYVDMLRTALAGVSAIPGAELIVKLHPRAPDDPIAHAVLSEFPSLPCRIVTSGPVEPWFDRVACVLSCFSSAGIDATLAGVPVIQLLPAGSGDVLPHAAWGTLGSARSEAELQALFVRAFAAREQLSCTANVFADLGASAAARIAEAVRESQPAGQARESAAGSATLVEQSESPPRALAPLESR